MKVTLKPLGREFEVAPGEDILTAALRNGIQLSYGCRHGNCSLCKQWLLEGDVDNSGASIYAISRDERDAGALLLCCAYPESDVVVGVDSDQDELPTLSPPVARTAVVRSTAPISESLIELRVELDEPLTFAAGQYVELRIPGSDERRSFSVLSAPGLASEYAFCIKRVPGGHFSSLLDGLQAGDELDLDGPFGTAVYRETGNPALFVANGSGIAPVLSILSDLVNRGIDVPLRFYYGLRYAADLVYLDRLAHFADSFRDFRLIPCFSRETSSTVANARVGRVTRVIAEEIRDASEFDAYVSGSPEMCDAIAMLLEAKGLPGRRLHVDRFFPALPIISG